MFVIFLTSVLVLSACSADPTLVIGEAAAANVQADERAANDTERFPMSKQLGRNRR